MLKRPDPSRPPMPPADRRLLWWMVLPLAVMVCGAVFYKLPATQPAISKPSIWLSVGVPIICFAPVFVAIFGIWHGQSRIKRAVLAAQGRACIHGVQDLRGFGDTGTCPECGHAFGVVADSRRWERVKMLP